MSNICCSKEHLFHPLRFTFKGKTHSVHHKNTLIIKSIVAGIFTFGIGGIFIFFQSTAEQKEKQLKRLQKKQNKIQKISKKLSVSTPKTYDFFEQFDSFNRKKSSLSSVGFEQCQTEFKILKKETKIKKLQEKFPHLQLIHGQSGQDRYTNNHPWVHTNVQLPYASFLRNTYINASWVNMPGQRKIIAAQGPNIQTLISFWHMAYSHDVNIIVMLSSAKGINYWQNASLEELPFSLETLHEYCTVLPSGYHLIERKLKIQFQDLPSKILYHFQIPDWPDFGAIDDPQTTHAALRLIESKATEENPWIVHCTAGLGRTGTFLAIRHLLANQSKTINVIRTIAEMRLLRPNLVQTPEQVEMIYETLAAKPKEEWKAQKKPQARLCIDFDNDSPRMARKKVLLGLTDSEGQELTIGTDEALLKCRCFYGNRAFVKKFNFKKLFLPASLFQDRNEGDPLELCFNGHKFRLILSQTKNTFDNNKLPFQNYLPRIKAKHFNHLQFDPYAGYSMAKRSCRYQLQASPDGIVLQKSEDQELKKLEAPEFITSQVEIVDNFLIMETLLPSAELSEIDILLTKEQIIVYAKMKDITVVDDTEGGSIELHLQNEYFAAIIWPVYTNLSYKAFAQNFKNAEVEFDNDKLTITIDIQP